MNYKKALDEIFTHIKEKDLVISSCGQISKYVFTYHHRKGNFYNVGSMGTTLPFAIGLALNTDKQVHAIVGDGELLSCLGSMLMMRKHYLSTKLLLWILDNGMYETTGCQPSVSRDFAKEILLDRTNVYGTWLYDIDEPNKPLKVEWNYRKLMEEFREAVNSV